MTFHVSYTIKNKYEDSRLIVNIGHTVLSSEAIYSNHLSITQWTNEAYKNLLAITSVSDLIRLKIFIRDSHEKVLKFLIDELNFELLSDSVEKSSDNFMFITPRLRLHFVLYCSSGYFNGVLVRLKIETLNHRMTMIAKIYVR